MSKSHNKKRNSLLLYEFLIATISKSLIEGDKKGSTRALKILKKHFKPGSELYKEFRLLHALRKTTVSSDSVAGNIIREAKIAARLHNVKELDRQKSLLIRDINHGINDQHFYDQQVNEYRFLATLQTLVNEWRTDSIDLQRVAQFEDQVVQHLISEKIEDYDSSLTSDTTSPGEGRLLMKIMMKKLNEKYAGVLTDEQKMIIKEYAFSAANDDSSAIKNKLTSVKDKLIEAIDNYKTNSESSEYITNKLDNVREQLIAESIDVVDDDTVTRFMLYTKLFGELTTEEPSNE